MPPLGVLVAISALFGLAIGSFLNVVIYRVPRHESIVSPPSACPGCHQEISPRDNIPVVSWLLLHGRCRNCGTAISAQYPLIELATGILFAGTAARFGYNWALPAYLVLFAGLLALSWIDVQVLLLPKAIVYPVSIAVAGLLVLASGLEHRWHALLIGALCGAGWFIAFFVLNLISPRILGFGDVRLVPVLGLALGWLGVNYLFLGFLAGNLIGAVVGITLIATKRIERQQQIAYGVFLAAGTAFAVFTGPAILKPFT